MFDILLVASLLLWTIPLSTLYRFLNPFQKHVYSFFVSNILVWLCFGYDTVIHTFVLSTSVWLVLRYMAPLDSQKKVLVVWGICLTYLSAVQFYTMWYNWLSWNITGTSVLMVLVIKLTTFTWYYN